MNQKQVDWISLIAIGVMLIGASFISYSYITKDISRCGRDPIKYAIDNIILDEIEGRDFDLGANYSHVRLILYADQEERIPIYDKPLYNPNNPPKPIYSDYASTLPKLDLSIFNLSE